MGASGPPPPAGKEPRALSQAPARPGHPAVKSADSRDGQLGPSPDLPDLRKTAPPARRGAPYEGSPDAEQQSPRGLGPGSVPTAASQRQALDAPGSRKEQELGLWSLCRQNRAQSHPRDQKPTDGPGARRSGLKVTFLCSQRTRRSPARSRRGPSVTHFRTQRPQGLAAPGPPGLPRSGIFWPDGVLSNLAPA